MLDVIFVVMATMVEYAILLTIRKAGGGGPPY